MISYYMFWDSALWLIQLFFDLVFIYALYVYATEDDE